MLTQITTALIAILIAAATSTAGASTPSVSPPATGNAGAAKSDNAKSDTALPSPPMPERIATINPLGSPVTSTVSNADAVQFPGEPFGNDWIAADNPYLSTKWNDVEALIHANRETLAQCRIHRTTCSSAAGRFIAVVDQGHGRMGLARIGVINRAVNLAVAPMSDMEQWGVEGHWSPPLETFATGRGDCKDYAIAKYVALMEAGIAEADLRLVIVHIQTTNEYHAITAVRFEGQWIMLDNRSMMLVRDREMPLVTPLFVLDQDGIKHVAPMANPAKGVSASSIMPAAIKVSASEPAD